MGAYKYEFLVLLSFCFLLTFVAASKLPRSALERCQSGDDGCHKKINTFIHGILGDSDSDLNDELLPSIKSSRAKKIENENKNETQDVFEDTLRLIAEGDRQIELRPEYRDIVLVAGLTGAGKTTITKFITNPEDLVVYEDGGECLIKDRVNDSISVMSTVVSKTIFPQLLIHQSSDTGFYDLPGFQDTRNATIEIANAFFMKKVAEHAKSVKLLLVVSYNSLRPSGSRGAFKTLIEQLVKFVPDIKKFSKGIVLVASKVESTKPNTNITNFVGEFLTGVNRDLKHVFQDPVQLRHAKALLSTLLEKDGMGKYQRIGIFRQPKKVGPLIEDPEFNLNKNHVRDLVLSKAEFVPTSAGDFGFSVSAASALFAKTLVTKTNQKVAKVIEDLVEVIDQDLFQQPANPSSPKSSLPKWMLLQRLTRQHKIFNPMNQLLKTVETSTQFFTLLKDNLPALSIPGTHDPILELFKLDVQLGFFGGISSNKESSDRELPLGEWVNFFDNLETKVGQGANELAQQLSDHVLKITTDMSAEFKQKIEFLVLKAKINKVGNTSQTLLDNLTGDFNSISQMHLQVLTSSTFAQFSNITLNLFQTTHLQVSPSILTSLKDLDFDMNFNSGINGQWFPFRIEIWTKPIEVFAGFLQLQIQTLSSHLTEEMRKANEAAMLEQLKLGQEERQRAVEKAEMAAAQLAMAYKKQQESLIAQVQALKEEANNRKRRKGETDYYWCYKRTGGWDYCSPESGKSVTGKKCSSGCNQGKTFWCDLEEGSWDHCGLVE